MSHPMEGNGLSETEHLIRDLEEKKKAIQLKIVAVDRLLKELKRLKKQDDKRDV